MAWAFRFSSVPRSDFLVKPCVQGQMESIVLPSLGLWTEVEPDPRLRPCPTLHGSSPEHRPVWAGVHFGASWLLSQVRTGNPAWVRTPAPRLPVGWPSASDFTSQSLRFLTCNRSKESPWRAGGRINELIQVDLRTGPEEALKLKLRVLNTAFQALLISSLSASNHPTVWDLISNLFRNPNSGLLHESL